MSTTPFTSPIKPSATTPATPTSTLRNRNEGSHSSSTAHDSSPTNSTLSDSAPNITGLRLGGDSRTALRNLASQPVVIRSDPSMLTCFDSADKELYDLWVPQH